MKTHWYTSPDPPQFGQDLTAACGAIVPSAQPVVAAWDNESEHGLARCAECERKLLTHRYAAVIQSGQESRKVAKAKKDKFNDNLANLSQTEITDADVPF